MAFNIFKKRNGKMEMVAENVELEDLNFKEPEELNTEMILTLEEFTLSMYARQMAIVDLLIKKGILTTNEIIENTKNIKNNEPFKSMFDDFLAKKETLLEKLEE